MVLSACDTGQGGSYLSGQGVYGLRQSLPSRWSRTLVTSLWQVSDAATKADDYQKATEGRAKLAAIQKAPMKQMRTQANTRQHYWRNRFWWLGVMVRCGPLPVPFTIDNSIISRTALASQVDDHASSWKPFCIPVVCLLEFPGTTSFLTFFDRPSDH